jgi:hypothetical protein
MVAITRLLPVPGALVHLAVRQTQRYSFEIAQPVGWVAGTNVTISWNPKPDLPELFQVLLQNKNFTLTLDNFVPTNSSTLNVLLPRAVSEQLPAGMSTMSNLDYAPI